MPRLASRFSIFYGWWIVTVGMLSLLLAGGIGIYTFGAFFTPLIDEFGWSRAQLSLAMTIASLVGLFGPMVGTWVDRYGARRVMAIGALIAGAAIALLGLTTSIWYFYVISLVMALGLVAILNIPVATAVSNWFVERRGLAMGITLTGFGLGGLAMIPLASYLIANLGWRMAYHLLGLLICIVLIPLSIFVIKHRPEEKGLLPDGKTPQESKPSPSVVEDEHDRELTLKGALRTKAFWLIAGALSLAFIGAGSVIAHVIPFFQDMGIPHQTAATILGLTIGVSILSRVAAGYIADRMSVKYLALFFLLLQIAGLLLLLGTSSMAMVWFFVVVFGLAIGGMFALEPLLISAYFGLASFGAIYGGLWVFVSIGFAAGPPLAGYIFDVTGSYDLAFILFMAATLVAMALLLFLKPVKLSWRPG
ncbi:MAG: MFS transporter [Dehalococcoidia bacterium]|nr:MAG: MFS transporter [Dehalococcoidia bacterium]